jgi:hypothetical protein
MQSILCAVLLVMALIGIALPSSPASAPEPAVPVLAPIEPIQDPSYEEEWGPYSQEFATGMSGQERYTDFLVPKFPSSMGTLVSVRVELTTTAGYTPKLGCSVSAGACSGGGFIDYHWETWVARSVVTHPSLALVANELDVNWSITSGASAPAGSCSPNFQNMWVGTRQEDQAGEEWGDYITDGTNLAAFTDTSMLEDEEVSMRVWWPDTINLAPYQMSCISYTDGWAVSFGKVEYTYDP